MRRVAVGSLLVAGALMASCKKGMADIKPQLALHPVPAEAMCATHGALHPGGGHLRISDPTVRAVAPTTGGDGARLRFVYGGPTQQVAALASGQIRRQVGLKLRAEDGCNLVYVMWRLEPKPGVEVSIKRNPGRHTHEECGASGYTKITPRRSIAAPRLKPGTEHTLQAEITGPHLYVWIDGKTVWRGKLEATAKHLVGPAGFRSDNVQIDVAEFAAPEPGAAVAADAGAAAPGESGSPPRVTGKPAEAAAPESPCAKVTADEGPS